MRMLWENRKDKGTDIYNQKEKLNFLGYMTRKENLENVTLAGRKSALPTK